LRIHRHRLPILVAGSGEQGARLACREVRGAGDLGERLAADARDRLAGELVFEEFHETGGRWGYGAL
jgi:hypothetical protein